MKKFLLINYFLGMVVFFGYSQSLSLIFDSNPIPNNSTLTFTGEPSTPVIVATVGVKNNSAGSLNIMCKKVEISLVTESQNTFCWDNCYPPNVYVSLGSVTIGPGETSIVFTGDYEPLTHAGQSVIRYVF